MLRCAGRIHSQALDAFPTLFGMTAGEGVQMAIRATEGLMLEAEVVESLKALPEAEGPSQQPRESISTVSRK